MYGAEMSFGRIARRTHIRETFLSRKYAERRHENTMKRQEASADGARGPESSERRQERRALAAERKTNASSFDLTTLFWTRAARMQ